MLKMMMNFFDFCGAENKHKFYKAIVLGVIMAMFEALKIPAIAVVAHDVRNQSVAMRTVWVSFGISLVSFLGIYYINYISTMLQTEGGYRTVSYKRIEIAEHLRYIPMGFFNQSNLGQITSVTTNTMDLIGGIATRVIMVVTKGILSAVFIVIAMCFVDYRIGAIAFIGIGLFFAVNAWMQKGFDIKTPEKTKSDEVLINQLLEYIQGISEVRAYNMMGKTNKDLKKAIERNVEINTEIESFFPPYVAVQNFITKLIGVVITFCSILFFFHGTMQLSTSIIMIIGSYLIYDGLDSAGSHSGLLRLLDINVEKVKEVLDTPQMDIAGKEITSDNYDISLKNVDFSYRSKKIIDNVSLDIPQKTVTAVVGPSGGGKTTLCNLIARFWDVDGGEITLSGHNVKEYSIDSLMKNFSFVFQKVYLFNDTVANNIRFGNPSASMEQVIDAAKRACCHDFIIKLPNGYETVIGEGGSSLSGGERQRISIARAIMKDSPIIILDEATANVDPENEKELMDAIHELTKEKTVIMIAHRLKTVRNADKIVVVDKGRIVQEGTHDELIKQEGIYQRFVDSRKQASTQLKK